MWSSSTVQDTTYNAFFTCVTVQKGRRRQPSGEQKNSLFPLSLCKKKGGDSTRSFSVRKGRRRQPPTALKRKKASAFMRQQKKGGSRSKKGVRPPGVSSASARAVRRVVPSGIDETWPKAHVKLGKFLFPSLVPTRVENTDEKRKRAGKNPDSKKVK